MAKKVQISLFAKKSTIKLLKACGVDWETNYGETFEAVMQGFSLLQKTKGNYPEDIQKSIEGIFGTALAKAKCPEESRHGWVGDGGPNDRGSLFSDVEGG